MPTALAPSADPAAAAGRIGVLVVAAAAAERQPLAALLRGDDRFTLLGQVPDAEAALQQLERLPARVALVCERLSGGDGYAAVRRIMETRALPVVLCLAPGAGEAGAVRAAAAGAVASVEWPTLSGADAAAADARLLQTLALMAEVRVVRRWSRAPAARSPSSSRPRAIGIGASTGGPPVLQTILAALPSDFALPVLVVQHIASGFLPGLADWLGQTSGPALRIAAHGQAPQPGHVYLAPDGSQMGLGMDGRIALVRATGQGELQPSVAHLFRSLADVCGAGAIGVLLTGMGKDGAAELKLMRDRGAVTIAQDVGSSVVHGMAGEAIALGGASHVLPADRIAAALLTLARTPLRESRETDACASPRNADGEKYR